MMITIYAAGVCKLTMRVIYCSGLINSDTVVFQDAKKYKCDLLGFAAREKCRPHRGARLKNAWSGDKLFKKGWYTPHFHIFPRFRTTSKYFCDLVHVRAHCVQGELIFSTSPRLVPISPQVTRYRGSSEISATLNIIVNVWKIQLSDLAYLSAVRVFPVPGASVFIQLCVLL